jgi:REP element-mobilizing transposase RayT
VDRFWLLTWRTYGTWLPGDPRGSVTRVREGDGPRVEHDTPGTPVEPPMPGLEASARAGMTAEPAFLDAAQADAAVDQFRETAAFRGWQLLAAAAMCNHVHVVVGVPGDPSPDKLLGDFKAWGTRRLNDGWGRRPNGTWWADGGSKRKLADERAVRAAVAYVARQPGALRVWVAPGWEPEPASGPA